MTTFDILLLLSICAFILLAFLWTGYNAFIKKLNQVNEDFSDIDIQLKRRADLIGQLVEVVKGYSKHEKKTLENIARLRSSIASSASMKEVTNAEQTYVDSLHTILAIVENYPKLKADQSYKDLMDNLKETEDNIAKYREEYNQSVKKYNSTIQTFPNTLTALVFNFKTAEYFKFLESNQ